MMHKLKKMVLILLVIFPLVSLAGKKESCPNLSQADHPDPTKSGWKISVGDPSGMHSFTHVLMSVTAVNNTQVLNCKYNENLSLVKYGQFQAANLPDWKPQIEIYGIDFWNCAKSIEICTFYQF